MAERRRLFFALWPDAALRQSITRTAAAVARERALGGRQIPPERVHLTLLFLGEVTARTEALLVEGAGRLALPGFDLTLDRAGCFYRSRVFWLGSQATTRKLEALWQGLRGIAAGAGVALDDRPLAPHVTCLRDIQHRIHPVPVRPITWRVREFCLVHSMLGPRPAAPAPRQVAPDAAEYHVVSQWSLKMPP